MVPGESECGEVLFLRVSSPLFCQDSTERGENSRISTSAMTHSVLIYVFLIELEQLELCLHLEGSKETKKKSEAWVEKDLPHHSLSKCPSQPWSSALSRLCPPVPLSLLTLLSCSQTFSSPCCVQGSRLDSSHQPSLVSILTSGPLLSLP